MFSNIAEASEEYQGLITEGCTLAEREEKDGGWAEYFDGDLFIEDDALRGMTAMMLENTKKWVRGLDEATKAVTVGGFIDYLFPIIRASFPNNVAHDLVSVQPMQRKVGLIFFFNYVIASNKGSEYTKGQSFFDALRGARYSYQYSSEVVTDEIVGDANGALLGFTHTLAYRVVRPGSLTITAGAVVGADDGNGNITGAGITGTVNYETGALNLTYAIAPAPADDPKATYEYDSETSGQIPEVDIQIQSSAIVAQRRALKFSYSMDAAADFQVEFGQDLDASLVATIAEMLRFETAREIIHDLWVIAGTPVSIFDKTIPAPGGYSKTDHYADFVINLNEASETIFRETQRAKGTWLVVDTKAGEVIKSIKAPMFQAAPPTPKTLGVHYIGTLNGMRCFEDPLLHKEPGAYAEGNVLMGYKGPDFWDAGYTWCPYQPLYTTGTTTLQDFVSRKGMAMRYAKKTILPEMYVRLAMIKT